MNAPAAAPHPLPSFVQRPLPDAFLPALSARFGAQCSTALAVREQHGRDEGAIAAIVDEVLADPASSASVADIKAGKDKAIGYLVGQIMKQSKGKANPALAQKLIRERL